MRPLTVDEQSSISGYRRTSNFANIMIFVLVIASIYPFILLWHSGIRSVSVSDLINIALILPALVLLQPINKLLVWTYQIMTWLYKHTCVIYTSTERVIITIKNGFFLSNPVIFALVISMIILLVSLVCGLLGVGFGTTSYFDFFMLLRGLAALLYQFKDEFLEKRIERINERARTED